MLLKDLHAKVFLALSVVLISAWIVCAQTPTIYYVTKTGSDANSCLLAQGIANAKLTLHGVLACESAGDTILVGDGTYTEGNIGGDGTPDPNILTSGTSATNRTTIRAINSRMAVLAPSGSGAPVIELQGKSHVAFIGIKFNATGSSNSTIKINTAPSTGLYFDDIEATGSGSAQGFICGSSPFLTVKNSRFHHNGSDEFDHGMYISTGCDDALIDGNELDNNAQLGVQIYAAPNRVTFRRNYIHGNCARVGASGTSAEVVIANDNHIVENNVVIVGPGCGMGMQVNLQTPVGNTLRQNSIYCKSGNCIAGIQVEAVAVNTTLQNNIALGFTNNIRNLGTGTILTTNRTTGTPSAVWIDPANGDLTLRVGSSAINAGTNLGFAFCGSSPDQGAFEAPNVTSAIIFGNLLDVTICNIAPPIIPGTFTVGCTGTGCGTPVVSTVSLLGGSGGIVRLELSGITGGNCAAGQTWTVSTSSTATTDSALVGDTYNQPLHTTTNFAVDSTTCDGTGGGSAPGGVIGQYEWEGNADDTSGSANHATVSNTSYVTGLSGQGLQTTDGADSYADTGLLSGHNPSTTHLVVATWVYIDPAQLGKTRDIWGVPTGTNQRFLLYRHSSNVWYMSIQGISGTASEFPVVSGWTHVCVKANATTDTATMYINGVAGTISGASVISYSSYTFAGDLRFGLPSGFGTTLSGTQTFDHSYLYTSDVSCADLYTAGQPPTEGVAAVQATHQWQGVFTGSGGSAENRGAADAQRTVVKGGAGAVMVQLNNTSGASLVLQPRFRYNLNGGGFANVVPDSPTADGISYWGSSIPTGLNTSLADGPISGALAHTDGVTLTTSAAVPTITMTHNSSYTLRGIFYIDASIGDVVCFKIYDQGGSALAGYTPADGACLTVIAPQATGGY